MATRLYLPPTGTAAVSPGFASEWESTGSAVRLPCSTSLTNATPAAITASEAVTTGNYDVLLAQFVSPPLAAQTITGTVKGQILARESSSTADFRSQLVLKVVSNDGSTVRGTLLAADTGTTLSEEWGLGSAVFANTKIPRGWTGSGASLSSVVVQAGDRLVAEVGYRAHNILSTSYTGGVLLNDRTADTDLTEGGSESDTVAAPDYRSWIELSQTLLWQGASTTYTKTASLGAIIQKQNLLKTASMGAVVQKPGVTKTASLGAVVKKAGITLTASAGAVVKKTGVTKAATLGAVVTKAGLTRSASLSALVQKTGLTASASLNALLLRTTTRTAMLGATVQKPGVTKTATADAVVQKANVTRTASADVLVTKPGVTRQASLSGAVQKAGITKTASVGALVKRAGIVLTAGLDAVIEATTATRYLTAAMNALVQARRSLTASLDATLQRPNVTKTAALGAVVTRAAIRATASLEALVTKAVFVSAGVDALVQKPFTRAASLSAVVQKTLAVAAALDVAVQKPGQAVTAGLDAVIDIPIPTVARTAAVAPPPPQGATAHPFRAAVAGPGPRGAKAGRPPSGAVAPPKKITTTH